MTYTVVVESSARQDIDDAYRWMTQNVSPESGALWYLDICGKYRILFEIDGETVRILHVRHSARKPLKPKRKK